MLIFNETKRICVALLGIAAFGAVSCTGHRIRPLEHIAEITALPFDVADRRIPVHIKGWVTVWDVTANLAYVEDGTGAVRVDLPFWNIGLGTGSRLEVIGEVNEGGAAPTIVANSVNVLDGSEKPRAMPIQVADLISGRTGFRFIAIEGVLRCQYHDSSGNAVARIGSGATVFEAHFSNASLPGIGERIGARIRLRGVANLSRDIYGRTARVQVSVPGATDLEALVPAGQNSSVHTVSEVARLPESSLAERPLLLRGRIVSDGVHSGLRLEDATGSIRIRPALSTVLAARAMADVVGFAEMSAGGLEITDASLVRPVETGRPAGKPRTITTVAAIHALSPDEAAHAMPVHVRATVTYINPLSNVWFVQDQTGPTYVSSSRLGDLKVRPGDLVDLTGVSAPGNFAPIISGAWAERISRSSMPPPAPVAFDELFSGKSDSAWVQTEGIVQSVVTKQPTLEDVVWLQLGEHRYRAQVANPGAQPLPPPDSRVRIQGVCGSLFNSKRQIVGIQIYVPAPEFVHLLEPAPASSTASAQPISELLQYSPSESPGHRARIRGVVTLASPTGPSYVEDSRAGVKIVDHAQADIRPGDVVDVLGFGHPGSFGPEMRDAQIALVERGPAPTPASITVDDALTGDYDSRLVSIDAAVVNQIGGSAQNVVMLQVGGKLFNAALDRGSIPPFDRGCIVHVTGVCSIAAEDNLSYKVPKSFSLVLRSPKDIVVVRPAAWWTVGHLLAVLGSVMVLLLAVSSWVAVLRRRVALQTAVISRKLEQEEQLKCAAEQSSRAKSEFLANMSHEIRTPMNGVMGMTEILLDSELTPQQRADLLTVRTSAESLLTVLNDILDFSKIEAGKLALDPIAFDARDNIEKMVRSMVFVAQQKNLELLCEIRPEVPDFVVGDPARLRQILVNLIGNAVKFTERGEVGVRVGVEEATEKSTTLHFVVSDTGIGIPAEKHAAIFQAFTQADASTTRQHGGTGLGLTISSRLVALMDGRIWVESTLGQGSHFHFTARFGIAPPQSNTQAGRETALLAGKPVAIVDDNATNRRILADTVTRWGMCASLAGNACDALLTLRSAARSGAPIPVMISDVQMAEMDGFALAERVLSDPELRGTKIILLTSGGQGGDAARCRELGVAAYLTKPVSASELLGAVAGALGQSPAPDRTRALVPRQSPQENSTALRILVAEDNPVNRQLIRRLLEKHRHQVIMAENGKEAVAAAERENFDLVLMDVQMPGMDGLEATAAIREREKSSGEHRQIVAMTAHAMHGDRERCLAAGMDGYLSKPIRPRELAEVLDAVHARSAAPSR